MSTVTMLGDRSRGVGGGTSQGRWTHRCVHAKYIIEQHLRTEVHARVHRAWVQGTSMKTYGLKGQKMMSKAVWNGSAKTANF